VTHSHDSRDVQNGKGCEWTRNDAKELTASTCIATRDPQLVCKNSFRIWCFVRVRLHRRPSTMNVGHILLVESEVHDGADVDHAVVVRGELVEVVEVVEHDVVLHPPVP